MRLRAMIAGMARPGTRPGTPTGPSWSITTRMPRGLEVLVRSRSDEQGLSYSDVIANAVAESFGRPAVIEPRGVETDGQEQLLAS